MENTILATTSQHYLLTLLEQATNKGLSANELLNECGFDLTDLRANSQRVNCQKLAKLIRVLWLKLQDENLGFCATSSKPGTFYMMGRVSVHEPNLHKSLAMAIRFYSQFVPGYTLTLQSNGDQAHLSVALANPELDSKHFLTELVLSAWHRYASWLIDCNIPITKATFAYPAPAHAYTYQDIFPGKHEFSTSTTGISFDAQYLSLRVLKNTQSLKSFMARCPADFYTPPEQSSDLIQQINQYLRKNLSTGTATIDDAAVNLNLTTQTLRRRLKQEGTSFRSLKDAIRRKSAQHHLISNHYSVSEVANLVGFSEPSVFIRAFKLWTGETPSQYRNNHA